MAKRPCIDCGTLTTKTRCPAHSAAVERNRKPRPTNLTRDSAERKRRADAVGAHRATYGNWCPGYEVEPHRSSDLTADHVISVSAGGDPNGPLQVLCRSCNGRKAGRWVGGTPST